MIFNKIVDKWDKLKKDRYYLVKIEKSREYHRKNFLILSLIGFLSLSY